MSRFINLLVAICLLAFILPVMLLIALLIKIDSKGPAIFKQQRVGLQRNLFTLYKFRTMVVGTPDLPSEMVSSGDSRFTRFGKVLRRFSLDELPQLVNIIKGDMNFVGPRPALYNQDDLIAMREKVGIHRIRPGITGWAQVNGRDAIPLTLKVQLDEYYLLNRSLWLDMKIIWMTFSKSLSGTDLYPVGKDKKI